MEEALIYSFQFPWPIYSLNFSTHPSQAYTLAVGSFVKSQYNSIQIITLDEELQSYKKICQVDQTYPQTKIMWSPDSTSQLLASSGDSLKIWHYSDTLTLRSLLLTDTKREFPPPLTSLDWNKVSPNIIGASCINTTCTIWDIDKEQALAHMIAHDQAAYDIAFSHEANIFATAGRDGSIRQFDLRNLENSAVLYEKQDISPCLRLAWNKHDPHYLATIMLESNTIVVLDMRHHSIPVYTLAGHSNCVNSLAWSPITGNNLLTGGDDHQALIWDVHQTKSNLSPAFSFSTDAEINNVVWSHANPDWIAISKNKEISVLRI
ncbi:hypothetical protein SteCoe_1597 [Stentor coeruleus]|uniref:Uncharacterized protein n=1 Tax=Stentor coeruleus TaxID=5963 RepID=A0A1R2D1E2_9CILI|nr:hypothetical protein SteCoe_1597 [Stentor coeruleus]